MTERLRRLDFERAMLQLDPVKDYHTNLSKKEKHVRNVEIKYGLDKDKDYLHAKKQQKVRVINRKPSQLEKFAQQRSTQRARVLTSSLAGLKEDLGLIKVSLTLSTTIPRFHFTDRL